ncbi:uncharacterized protein LY79DRAFT_135612 [Colletotrichum navitas]|uniref:Uncharacterized protein n=1 Tax=Colletotrichum navitas TaxID=681940 RepID=A0AAD8Q2E9_9PEZI|nr:uncharacterized protein LY79DRAFT_135612 [Colletotrichum navitas]KAK1594645.1 hypothetical protein LY79DRAFT_135612 [Colletotrichum navitas]
MERPSRSPHRPLNSTATRFAERCHAVAWARLMFLGWEWNFRGRSAGHRGRGRTCGRRRPAVSQHSDPSTLVPSSRSWVDAWSVKFSGFSRCSAFVSQDEKGMCVSGPPSHPVSQACKQGPLAHRTRNDEHGTLNGPGGEGESPQRLDKRIHPVNHDHASQS